MRIFLLCLVAALASWSADARAESAVANGARGEPACARLIRPTEVRIDRIAAPVTYKLDESAAEIGARSGLTSQPGSVVRGLTQSAFHSQLSVTFATMQTSAGVCVQPAAIELHIGFDPVIVYIERDYGRGSCQYEAIDGHEQQHVRNMDTALDAWLPRIRAALDAAADDRRYPMLARDEEAAQTDGVAIINAALDVPLDGFARDRAAMDAALDSPDSYKALKASCATW
ncbi:MAG: hypothetical protein ACM30I_04500 [Gemmatimonas sp.]